MKLSQEIDMETTETVLHFFVKRLDIREGTYALKIWQTESKPLSRKRQTDSPGQKSFHITGLSFSKAAAVAGTPRISSRGHHIRPINHQRASTEIVGPWRIRWLDEYETNGHGTRSFDRKCAKCHAIIM